MKNIPICSPFFGSLLQSAVYIILDEADELDIDIEII